MEKQEEKQEYGYCTNCGSTQKQKHYPMTYNVNTMQSSQDFVCLKCHRIKTVRI
ncbi:hypothetical protein LCGC14_2988940 [marine sediment metagenome]|uniref:Uncharacterized protein n=1 Tax=marine sediment metagenome TaxID=412755 RepID=A0A0F8ZBX5_9ZZZZ